jgi:hypothetical protein
LRKEERETELEDKTKTDITEEEVVEEEECKEEEDQLLITEVEVGEAADITGEEEGVIRIKDHQCKMTVMDIIIIEGEEEEEVMVLVVEEVEEEEEEEDVETIMEDPHPMTGYPDPMTIPEEEALAEEGQEEEEASPRVPVAHVLDEIQKGPGRRLVRTLKNPPLVITTRIYIYNSSC